MSNKIHIFGTLYSLSSKGKVKQWDIWVEEREGQYYIGSSHGYQEMKMVIEYSSAIQGKNIGKKNETSSLDQAVLEARSKWRAKIDKNYSQTIPGSTEDFVKVLPMLAHKYHERKHNITFPCYVQPKLEGVRCLADPDQDDEFKFISRGGKEYTTLLHIESELADILAELPGPPLDGEIFNPEMSFQDISRAVKKQRDTTGNLQYWVYDVAATDLDFEDRLKWLNHISKHLPKNGHIVIVPTFLVETEEELLEHHKEFSLKYEGTMVRNMKGKYVFDYRSTDLLKLKDFIDEEFPIVGAEEGSGSDEGTVIFKCKTKEDRDFNVRPRGSRQQRRDWLEDFANIVDGQLTVRYQSLSEDGIPIFPVGIAVREPGT